LARAGLHRREADLRDERRRSRAGEQSRQAVGEKIVGLTAPAANPVDSVRTIATGSGTLAFKLTSRLRLSPLRRLLNVARQPSSEACEMGRRGVA
jgi:hypothetical protein